MSLNHKYFFFLSVARETTKDTHHFCYYIKFREYVFSDLVRKVFLPQRNHFIAPWLCPAFFEKTPGSKTVAPAAVGLKKPRHQSCRSECFPSSWWTARKPGRNSPWVSCTCSGWRWHLSGSGSPGLFPAAAVRGTDWVCQKSLGPLWSVCPKIIWGWRWSWR